MTALWAQSHLDSRCVFSDIELTIRDTNTIIKLPKRRLSVWCWYMIYYSDNQEDKATTFPTFWRKSDQLASDLRKFKAIDVNQFNIHHSPSVVFTLWNHDIVTKIVSHIPIVKYPNVISQFLLFLRFQCLLLSLSILQLSFVHVPFVSSIFIFRLLETSVTSIQSDSIQFPKWLDSHTPSKIPWLSK